MRIRIEKVGTFEPAQERARNWTWINNNGDGGSTVVYSDEVVHLCASAWGPDSQEIPEHQAATKCKLGCGVPFYPETIERTRKLHCL